MKKKSGERTVAIFRRREPVIAVLAVLATIMGSGLPVEAHPATVARPGSASAVLDHVTAISAYGTHSLALRSDGTVVAWGWGSGGELGDGTALQRTTPVRVCAVGETYPCTRSLDHVTSIRAGGSHSLALRRDGTVVGWGANFGGEVGDGTGTQRNVPVRVCAVRDVAPCTRHLRKVRAIAAGDTHSLALLDDGTVVAWGRNWYGQLGDGTSGAIDRRTPVRVCAVGEMAPCTRFLRGVRAIAARGRHSMALLADGTVLAWGWNSQGEIGDGSNLQRDTPVRVCAVGEVAPCTRFLQDVRAIATGVFDGKALLRDGSVVAWGCCQIGDGYLSGSRTPVRVCAVDEVAPCTRQLRGVRKIAAAGSHSMALLRSSVLVAWGHNLYGQAGDGTRMNRFTPVRVCAVGEVAPCSRFLSDVRAVAGGGEHSMALLRNGTVVSWGRNAFGQLGDGTDTDRTTPGPVLAP